MSRTLVAVAMLWGIPFTADAGDDLRRETAVRDLVVLPAQYLFDAARLFDLTRIGTAVSWGREATAVVLAAVEEKRAVCEGDKCAVKPGDHQGGEHPGARSGACPHCNREGHGVRRGPPPGAMLGHGRPPHSRMHHRGGLPHVGMHHRGAPHAGMSHGGPSRMGPPHHGGPGGPYQFGPGRRAGPQASAHRGHPGPMHRGPGRHGFAHHGGRGHRGPPHHMARGHHAPSHHGRSAHAGPGARSGCEHCRHARGNHGRSEPSRRPQAQYEHARPGHQARSPDHGGDARREMFEKLMRERHEQLRRHMAARMQHGRDAGPSRREDAAKDAPRDGAKPEGDRRSESAHRPAPQLPWFAQGGMPHPGLQAFGRMAPQGEGARRPEPQGLRGEVERRPNSPEGRGPGANVAPGEHRGPSGPPSGGDHRVAELERKVDSLTKAVEMLAKSLKEKSSK